MTFVIRKGERQDIPAVFELINELAAFEKAPDEVVTTIDQLEEDGFGERKFFEFFVAEANEKIVGLALYYFSYSTWKGKSLYLDDLIVKEAYRGNGIGSRLFNRVFEVAEAEQCGKVHWQVLDWNSPAIEYYKKLGASFDGEWINCAVTKDQVKELNRQTQVTS